VDPTSNNAPPLATTARWARVHTEMKFIESRMKLRYGRNFECLKMIQINCTQTQVGECWGSPCSVDGECLDDEICYQPGRDLNDRCAICDNAAGCACVIGQCLKFF
jgi:hypothetical protein